MSAMTDEDFERFLKFVRLKANGCWEWLGKNGSNGYPYFWLDGKNRLAHRLSHEHHIGPIPENFQVDHVCHNNDLSCSGYGEDCPHRKCVNPAHLEAVPAYANVHRSRGIASRNAKKTVCDNGHEFTEGNTYTYPNGERGCRTCRRIYDRAFKDKHGGNRAPANSAKSECPKGHPYDEKNTRINSEGKRVCITCTRERDAEYKRNKRGSVSKPLSEKSMTYRTACKNGHEWTEENTITTGLRRQCKACREVRSA